MQTVNKGGDVLASGGVRNTFPPAGGSISQEKWDGMWEGFDAEAYKNAPNPAQVKTESTPDEGSPVEESQGDQTEPAKLESTPATGS
jgi:hypothetical protein